MLRAPGIPPPPAPPSGLPGPGVVNARHRLAIRPTQGRVSELLLDIPAGFTVSEVTEGPAGAWRFDPEKRELRMSVEPAPTETGPAHSEKGSPRRVAAPTSSFWRCRSSEEPLT